MNFIGTKVNHKTLGEGVVIDVNYNKIKVTFKSCTQEFSTKIVFEKEIIKFINPNIHSSFLYYLKQQQEIEQLEYNDQLDKAEQRVASNRLNNSTFLSKKITTDFTHIVLGHIYGTNSRTIFEEFCKTLYWDKSKADCFGWQTPLYAENADTDRTRDVWFIFYPNYDAQKLDSVVDNYHVVNLIQNNGENIIEIVDDYIDKSNNANRITFVRTNSGYEFLGVYEIVKNGTTRIYKRISDRYPI